MTTVSDVWDDDGTMRHAGANAKLAAACWFCRLRGSGGILEPRSLGSCVICSSTVRL